MSQETQSSGCQNGPPAKVNRRTRLQYPRRGRMPLPQLPRLQGPRPHHKGRCPARPPHAEGGRRLNRGERDWTGPLHPFGREQVSDRHPGWDLALPSEYHDSARTIHFFVNEIGKFSDGLLFEVDYRPLDLPPGECTVEVDGAWTVAVEDKQSAPLRVCLPCRQVSWLSKLEFLGRSGKLP